MSHVRRGAFCGYPRACRLRDCVHLSVNGSDAVLALGEAPHVRAVRHSGRGAVVASGDDAVVLDKHTPNRGPGARRACGCERGELREVLVPGGSTHARIARRSELLVE